MSGVIHADILGVQMKMSLWALSQQMADLMRKITQCYEALEGVETSAKNAFVQVTG